MSSDDLRESIYGQFSQKTTDELIEIWQANDRVEWSETTFDVIREILQERQVELPAQDEAVLREACRLERLLPCPSCRSSFRSRGESAVRRIGWVALLLIVLCGHRWLPGGSRRQRWSCAGHHLAMAAAVAERWL